MRRRIQGAFRRNVLDTSGRVAGSAKPSIALAVLCMLGAAGIAVAATGRDRHEAIYPAQRIPIEFSHSVHVKPEAAGGQVGAFCEACHENAPKSQKASDVLVPKAVVRKESTNAWPDHDACDSCHDIANAAKGLPT